MLVIQGFPYPFFLYSDPDQYGRSSKKLGCGQGPRPCLVRLEDCDWGPRLWTWWPPWPRGTSWVSKSSQGFGKWHINNALNQITNLYQFFFSVFMNHTKIPNQNIFLVWFNLIVEIMLYDILIDLSWHSRILSNGRTW